MERRVIFGRARDRWGFTMKRKDQALLLSCFECLDGRLCESSSIEYNASHVPDEDINSSWTEENGQRTILQIPESFGDTKGGIKFD
jgi:hypothetical protein